MNYIGAQMILIVDEHEVSHLSGKIMLHNKAPPSYWLVQMRDKLHRMLCCSVCACCCLKDEEVFRFLCRPS